MGSREKNFISSVIYVHNAENRIGSFLRNIIQVMEDNFDYSEVICVNDFSEDNSVAVIKKVSQEAVRTDVSILNMSSFHGLEVAMGAGVSLSIGDFVLEFDTTMQDFGNGVIMEVYHKSLEGYDIVGASPKGRQRLSSKAFYKLLNMGGHFMYEIHTERFRILSRRAINRIESMNRSVPYRKAAYANCGLPICDIIYDTENLCKNGMDRSEREYRKDLAVDTLILFTQMGYKAILGMAIFMMAVVVSVMLYSLFVYLNHKTVEGWTTIILFMSFSFLGLFGILSIVIKYLQMILNLVFRQKNYNFKGIEKLTK